MLLAAIRALGCEAVDLGRVGDTEESLQAGLAAATQCDALITSGGVSMGVCVCGWIVEFLSYRFTFRLFKISLSPHTTDGAQRREGPAQGRHHTHGGYGALCARQHEARQADHVCLAARRAGPLAASLRAAWCVTVCVCVCVSFQGTFAPSLSLPARRQSRVVHGDVPSLRGPGSARIGWPPPDSAHHQGPHRCRCAFA
jgi:hypothetical protein